MCGIIGIISPDTIHEKNFIQARDLLIHRGPDDAGIWFNKKKNIALGHRRLSIIDLSSLGHQPMCNENKSLWLTYNGEIYNYKEIREELTKKGYVFKSKTDSEVIIYSYEEWGVECLKRFNGMFAFAIWDEAKKELFAARDRIGIKPFFYYWDGKNFAFASEIKSLKFLYTSKTEIDSTSCYDFFTYLYIPAPKTIYKNVKKLPAGHYLTFKDNKFELKEYWDINFNSTENYTENQAIKSIEEILSDSIKKRLISDVPLGVFLSGGVDSSGIVAMSSEYVDEQLKTFSVGFDIEEHSEIHYSRIVSGLFKTDHNEQIMSCDYAKSIFNKILFNYDEPFGDTSAIPTYLVAKTARKKVTVALSGDGGDEVFGGYKWYENYNFSDRVKKLSKYLPQNFWKFLNNYYPEHLRGRGRIDQLVLPDIERYVFLMGGLLKKEKRKILNEDLIKKIPRDYDDYWHFRKYWNKDLDVFTRLQYLDLKTYLADDILTKVDRASMLVSLEARVPLLDHRLVEAVFSLKSDIRNRGFEKKYIFKKMLKKYLPDEILNRPKKGFSIPFSTWFEDDLIGKNKVERRYHRINLIYNRWQDHYNENQS